MRRLNTRRAMARHNKKPETVPPPRSTNNSLSASMEPAAPAKLPDKPAKTKKKVVMVDETDDEDCARAVPRCLMTPVFRF